MLEKLRKLLMERGQGVVEYALLLGFVAIVALGLFKGGGLYDSIKDFLETVTDMFRTVNNAYK